MDKSIAVLEYFPVALKTVLQNIDSNDFNYLNEINITVGQPITVRVKGKYYFAGANGISLNPNNGFKVSKEHVNRIFEIITHSSSYAYKRFINDGFLTLEGGHRVGISGNCILDKGEVVNINHINSFCFRINHNISSNIDIIIDDIFDGKHIKNTVIISPPGCGKTTFLRTIARYLAGFNKNKIVKCSIIDERYEIAPFSSDSDYFGIGLSSSVISGCKKSIAIPMVVRSMTPDVILTDELASSDDIESILYARASGCKIVATAHGIDEQINEIKTCNITSLFDIIIVLNSNNGPGTIAKVVYGDKL